jgi:hypothetical protein
MLENYNSLVKTGVYRLCSAFLFFAFLSTKLRDALKQTIFQGLFHDPDRKRAVDIKH